jgi:hypothetical protein
LERQLERRFPAAPAPELRARVAQTVAGELRRQAIESYSFLGAAAAAFVLVVNLSWTASRNTTFAEPPDAANATVAAQLRELLPELSEAEARRHAVLISAALRLPGGR